MAKKGLDTTFVHYGIRKEDMSLIEALCTEHALEFDWIKEDGVSGKDFQEIKEPIAGLRLGELIIKNPTAIALGMGKKYKKIKVSHLI